MKWPPWGDNFHVWASNTPIVSFFYLNYDSFRLDRYQRKRAKQQAAYDQENAPLAPLFTDAPENTVYRFRHLWRCNACGRDNAVYLDKYAACLESLDGGTAAHCNRCDAPHQFSGGGNSVPDGNVFAMWANDPDLFLPGEAHGYVLFETSFPVLITQLAKTVDAEKCEILGWFVCEHFDQAGPATAQLKEAARQWLLENRPVWDTPQVWEYAGDTLQDMVAR